jgi:quercetin dioxygenase-like cupin family protein
MKKNEDQTTKTARVQLEASGISKNEAEPAPAWTPPPGVHPTVLHGSIDEPLLVAMVTLDPGAEVPREVHAGQTETVVVIAGEVDLVRGRQSYRLDEPDACITIPVDCEHTIRNASDTAPASYLAVLRRVEPAPASDTTPAPAPPVELTPAVERAGLDVDEDPERDVAGRAALAALDAGPVPAADEE